MSYSTQCSTPGQSGTTTISTQVALSGGTLTINHTGAATLASGAILRPRPWCAAASPIVTLTFSSATLDGVTLGTDIGVPTGTTRSRC